MGKVNRYRLVMYGSSPEKPHLKAKIELYERDGERISSVGKIRFHEGGELPGDTKDKSGFEMHLPASLLEATLDVLRKESPLYCSFHEGRAVLGTGVELIGSHDEKRPRLVRILSEEVAEEPQGAESPATEAEETGTEVGVEDAGAEETEGAGEAEA